MGNGSKLFDWIHLRIRFSQWIYLIIWIALCNGGRKGFPEMEKFMAITPQNSIHIERLHNSGKFRVPVAVFPTNFNF